MVQYSDDEEENCNLNQTPYTTNINNHQQHLIHNNRNSCKTTIPQHTNINLGCRENLAKLDFDTTNINQRRDRHGRQGNNSCEVVGGSGVLPIICSQSTASSPDDSFMDEEGMYLKHILNILFPFWFYILFYIK